MEQLDDVVSPTSRKQEIRDMLSYKNQEDVDNIISFMAKQVKMAYIAGSIGFDSHTHLSKIHETLVGEAQMKANSFTNNKGFKLK